MHAVTVDFGNSGTRRVYATVPTFSAAQALRTAAKQRGFKDVRIEDSRSFYEATRTNVWGQRYSESAAWEEKHPRVHDLRGEPEAATQGEAA